ncbi:MAG TPA: hypothetical protein VH107_05285 [Lacipirellulaceae bacterium]|nr:hypothetical protein [Lacipirellulaceae bacterium]
MAFLTIALWIRSYWRMDATWKAWQALTEVASYRGAIHYYYGPSLLSPENYWRSGSFEIQKSGNEFLAMPPTLGPLRATCRLIVPDGIILLVICVIAAAPWIKWRFSLRTLLIAITPAAGVLLFSTR